MNGLQACIYKWRLVKVCIFHNQKMHVYLIIIIGWELIDQLCLNWRMAKLSP